MALSSSTGTSSQNASSSFGDLHSPNFLLSNICNLISIRLDSSNYILLKFQLTAILKAHKLFGFIDSSLAQPERFLRTVHSLIGSSSTDTSQMNPLFDDWVAKDQALMTLINATLSPAALLYGR